MRPCLDTVSGAETLMNWKGHPQGVRVQDHQGDAGGVGLVRLGEKRAGRVVVAVPNYLKGGWREGTAQRCPVKG